MFEGYGKGWSETKAKGFLPRLRQRMREPATYSDWVIGAVWIVAFAAFMEAFK